MKKIFSFLTVISLLASCLENRAYVKEDNTVDVNSIEDLQEYFRYDPNRDILISGHRGGMMDGFPENCVESCAKTLSLMHSFFEVDFSFTKDSVLVLMHDLTLDRTTTGKGKVSDYTYEELQQFNLVDRKKNVTPYKIQKLRDLLEWGKDRCVFNFDNKYINTKGVSEEEKQGALEYYAKQLLPGGDWSMYSNIMLSVRSIEEAEFYWNKGVRNVMFCVEISKPEHFEAYEKSPIPWSYIMAYIRLHVDPRMKDVYDKLHERGVMLMTSIAGSTDKLKKEHDRTVGYLHDLMAMPDIIETDYPTNFIELPLSRKDIKRLIR